MIEIFSDEDFEEVIDVVSNTALESFGIKQEDVSVEITTIDKEEMKEMNTFHRGVERPTDVLTLCEVQVKLPFDKKAYKEDVNPVDGSIFLGEIFICPEVAEEQAKEYGHCITREMAFLTCHGMLHLLGYDHVEKADEQVMLAKQDEILDKLGITR